MTNSTGVYAGTCEQFGPIEGHTNRQDFNQDNSEGPTKEKSNRLQEILSSMQSFSSISSLMRLLGAMALVAGMSVFLLQGWEPGDDSSRFLMMLAQTLLMTVAGFGLHFALKENKGARLFFGLSLVSVIANFTVLGALVYSVTQLDSSLQNLPSYATWMAADTSALLLSFGVGLLVLVPVTFFGFQLLARGNSKVFSALYLGLGALLLIPVREPSIVVGLIAIATLVLVKVLRSRDMPNTWERKFASATLFIPLIVMSFRSLYFYDVEAFAMLIILGISYYGCRELTQKLNTESPIKMIINLASIPLAAWLSVAFFGTIDGFFHGYRGESLQLLISTVVFSGLMADLYVRSIERKYRTVFSTAGTIFLAIGIAISLAILDIWFTTLAAIVVAVIWSICGYAISSKTMTFGGIVIAAFLLITEFITLLSAIDLSNWMTLSILGGSTIVIASILDRHGAALKERVKVLAANRE